MTGPNVSEIRRRAWDTRREKYGARGHSSSYARPPSSIGRRALRMVAQLHEEGVLSEGQCCRALKMGRIDFRVMCDDFRNLGQMPIKASDTLLTRGLPTTP